MKVSEVMTRDVQTVRPDQPVQDAASFMLSADAGSIPVTDGEKLIGMITDRDIAVRAVAQGKGPDTPVREVMSTEKVLYCYDDEELEHVASNMGDKQVRRLPVVNRDKRLVGILSLGDLANRERKAATRAVSGVSKPGGQHSQGARI